MKKKMVAGNWKMHLTLDEAIDLIISINELISEDLDDRELVVCPPFTFIHPLQEVAKDTIQIGAQTVSEHENGAYTGEVSAEMLESMGVKYVIIGHSERRALFHESDSIVLAKVKKALSNKLNPIVCVGEPIHVRKSKNHLMYVEHQLKEIFSYLPADQVQQLTIAYEPIWAIGTGETASPEEVEEMHVHIRSFMEKQFGSKTAEAIRLLYGGSVKPNNAKEIFSRKDVDGGLIGGASLQASSFVQILNSF